MLTDIVNVTPMGIFNKKDILFLKAQISYLARWIIKQITITWKEKCLNSHLKSNKYV
jgi:hypothetical protein